MIIWSRAMCMVCRGHLIQIEWLDNIGSIQLWLTRARLKGKKNPHLSVSSDCCKVNKAVVKFGSETSDFIWYYDFVERGSGLKESKIHKGNTLWMWFFWHLVELQMDYADSFKHSYFKLRRRQIIGVFLFSLIVADVHQRAHFCSCPCNARYEFIHQSSVLLPLLPVVS